MALELTVRHGTVRPKPDLSLVVPDIKSRFQRQDAEHLSPTDTPRKNKRKLSEPKRRTTDFSIKRLCPDSPGSACSESGRSEESTPERLHEDSRDSVDCISPIGLPTDRDIVPSYIRPPYVFPDGRQHPYFIPQFYYNRFPGFSGNEHLAATLPPGMSGLPTMPGLSVPKLPPRNCSSQDLDMKQTTQTSNSREHESPVPSKKSFNSLPNSSSPKQQTNIEDDADDDSPDNSRDNKRNRKNYKNMTRERRVEANARERSRVHTISAAFEGLRRAVPSYSYNQKLSKLAILRIACSYINALSKLADGDEDSSSINNTSFAECVDNCTRTIQTEGKARRRH
ncbi:myoblast proliferation [Mactra antiquata]